MYGDAGGGLLSSANPMRWSAYVSADEICDQLCRETRPIVVEPRGGARWPALPPAECMRRLDEPVRLHRLSLSRTLEEQRARADAAARARLASFKAAVIAEAPQAASRTDAFFLRFLKFNESFYKGAKPDKFRVGDLPKNFKGVVLVKDLAADFKAHLGI